MGEWPLLLAPPSIGPGLLSLLPFLPVLSCERVRGARVVAGGSCGVGECYGWRLFWWYRWVQCVSVG